MNDTLEIRDGLLQYGKRVVAEHMNASFMKPEIVSIIGPNGSGKSTLLKALGRLLPPRRGAVYLNGRDMRDMPSSAIARRISVLPQSAQAPGDMTARDLATCGRIPYGSAFSRLTREDERAVDEAVAATGLTELQERRIGALSGGERQRAWLAMALAQEPKILLLDEPTTFLDIHYQLELMELITRLHTQTGITIIMVMHDLNYAARFSQRLIAVKNGCVVADGPVGEVFRQDVLERLYDVNVCVTEIQQGNRVQPICMPYLREHI